VSENQPPDVRVGRVSALDTDLSPLYRTFSYGFVSSSPVQSGGQPTSLSPPFLIDSTTGEISTVRGLDREDVSAYTLHIIAYNDVTAECTAVHDVRGQYIRDIIAYNDVIVECAVAHDVRGM